MDGYTFMIERNSRLIQHEDRGSAARAKASSADSSTREEAELRQDLLDLYHGLEGCGRVHSKDQSK